MKKIVRSIAVVVLMFVAATGLAKEPKLSLTPNVKKSLDFEMDITSCQTIVSIVDLAGEIIFTEKIATGISYAKKFDLKNLPGGSYFLEVDNSLKETIFEFLIEDSKIKIAERKENVKPIFRKNEGRVFVNFLNLEKEAVEIKVLDSESRLVFEETISGEMLIEKVFNFETALKDDYTVVIKTKEDRYYETVTVK